MTAEHLETTEFDVAEYLNNDEVIRYYLQEILATGTIAEFLTAIGDIARAKGMTQLAKETGLGRESLYKTLSGKTRPHFDTIIKITNALGIPMGFIKP